MNHTEMEIGDVEMEDDKYGHRCVACDCGADPQCEMCEGSGKVFELIAPAHEIAEAFANIFSQLPERKH